MGDVPVRLILRQKQAVVVERMIDGKPVRKSIPESYLKDKNGSAFMDEEEFEYGIDYGVPLSDFLTELCITPTAIEEEFHRIGLWTANDIRRDPKAAQGAVLASCRRLLAQINNIVAEYNRKED